MIQSGRKSQAEIARQFGVDKSLITKHLNKERSITIEHLEMYADLFNTSPEKLLEATYEWEKSEYQQFTNFLPKNEQPTRRASTKSKQSSSKASKQSQTKKVSVEEEANNKNFLSKMSYLFAGVAVASAGTLVVNALAKKAEKKTPKV